MTFMPMPNLQAVTDRLSVSSDIDQIFDNDDTCLLCNCCLAPGEIPVPCSHSKEERSDPKVAMQCSGLEVSCKAKTSGVCCSSPPSTGCNTSATAISSVCARSSSCKSPLLYFWGHKWTAEQDQQLKAAVGQVGGARQWKQVAECVNGRTHVQCRQRWETMKPGRVKGKWSSAEDQRLVSIMSGLRGNAPNWTRIARQVSGRTAKQCKYRWATQLDPTVNKAPFAQQEVATLADLRRRFGRNWVKMYETGEVPGRTPNMLKNFVKRQERKQKRAAECAEGPVVVKPGQSKIRKVGV